MAASTLGAPIPSERRAEVVRLSAEQSERFAVRDSPVLFECAAYYPVRRMGVRQQKLNYEAACWLRITEDGLATCTVTASGELVWSAHLDPPNQWKFSGVTFAFVRVGEHTYTTRSGPFVANLSADIATPFVGFFKMFRGYTQRGELKRVLRAREAQRPAPPTS
jgi:hypothetical protein